MSSRDELFSLSVVPQEYSAFLKHRTELFDGIRNLTALSTRLYPELLTQEAKNRITAFQVREEQCAHLLDSVEAQIKMDPQNFYKFVKALEQDQAMQRLCAVLRNTCGT